MTDLLTLTVGGRNYQGWQSVSVTRGLDRMCAEFSLEVSERWLGRALAWPIQPWQSCTVSLAGTVILTGYVDAYEPSYAADTHRVAIRGRSKTEDIVDCGPEIVGGQFQGYTLDAIARAVCQPFGVAVVVEVAMGDAFADATIQRAESAYAFIERLCRLRGILACDDGYGRLVLTHAGASRAAGIVLEEGVNILAASARLDVARRFSKYIIRTQHGITADVAEVETDVIGSAVDASCPRYRPHVAMGEGQMTLQQATLRAHWQAVYNTARSLEATVTVAGWRKPGGALWAINEVVTLRSAKLGIDRDMLVVEVTWSMSESGSATVLKLGPVEGYVPDPGQVRPSRRNKGAVDSWDCIGSVS